LTLHRHTGELIARGFRRFFNLNEIEETFDWNSFHSFSKEDGSFVLVFYYRDQWCLQTRNSFAQCRKVQ